jgi:tRNA threonylcarbamoyladenosine biosynthesis protein TsaB
MILAIDTTTSWASLALIPDNDEPAMHAWNIGRRHSTEILGAIDNLLHEAGVAKSAITAIATCLGPGSFNGTRVGVTTAKILAFVWNIPVVGVTTLAAIAQTVSRDAPGPQIAHSRMLALMEAGRDELFMGWYDLDWAHPGGLAQATGEPSIATIPSIVEMIGTVEIVVAGEITPAHAEALRVALGDRATIFPEVTARAVGLGQIAQARIAAGDLDDPLTLEPVYIRRPNITQSSRHPVPQERGES